MRQSIPRLHSVQLKSGGVKVRVIQNGLVQKTVRNFDDAMRQVREQRKGDMLGYAIVAWGLSGSSSTCAYRANGSPIGAGMIPDYAKTQIADFITGATSISEP